MATPATTRGDQATAFTPTLVLAFALGVHPWKRGCTTGAAQRPRERPVPAGDGHRGLEARRRAKRRLGVPAEVWGMRCDAAGRDGLWCPRFCVSQGGEYSGVDESRC
jgi:hypothetical protein